MRSDDRGILSMPMKIAISMAVICALAPIALDMARSAEDGIGVSPAVSEAERIKAAIGEVWSGGSGTMVSLDVSLPAGMSIEAGGDISQGYALRILQDGELRARVYLDRPSIRVAEPVSVSGDATVTVKCLLAGGELVAVIRT